MDSIKQIGYWISTAEEDLSTSVLLNQTKDLFLCLKEKLKQ